MTPRRWVADEVLAVVPLAAVVAILAALGGCASRPDATRVIEGGLTVRVAPRLTELPRDATYAWIAADSLLGRLNVRDRELSAEPGVDHLRRDVDVVLGSHGWRQAPVAEAEFVIALAHVERLARSGAATRRVVEVQCPASAQPRPECRPPVRTTGGVTTETPTSRHGAWLARAIRRRADGAQSVSMLPLAGMQAIDLGPPLAEQLVRLFLGDERAR